MNERILGIVGSYRKGGVIDSMVTEALAAAREHGAVTEKLYLIDKHIEFCTNCRTCTQQPGEAPGKCVLDDEMPSILALCQNADGLVIGAPVNFFNINAITRRFMERLVCYAYWPWGQAGPAMRTKTRSKRAILITSSAMPGFLGRIFTGAPRALRILAKTLGAKPIATLFVGLIADREKPELAEKTVKKARQAGLKLAMAIRK